MSETVNQIVVGLSELIALTAKSVESERHHPGASPDDSDDKIRDGVERLAILRRIREEFENEMAK